MKVINLTYLYWDDTFSLKLLASWILFVIFLLSIISVYAHNWWFEFQDVTDQQTIYECGFDPFVQQSKNSLINIEFIKIAIFFLIFDAELIFFFSWVLNFTEAIIYYDYIYINVGFILIYLMLFGFFMELKLNFITW